MWYRFRFYQYRDHWVGVLPSTATLPQRLYHSIGEKSVERQKRGAKSQEKDRQEYAAIISSCCDQAQSGRKAERTDIRWLMSLLNLRRVAALLTRTN